MKVGVFSPNDPRPWVREENIDHMLGQERILTEALQGEGVEVTRGGEGLPKMDQIAWNTRLVMDHVKRISAQAPDALIINQGSWTFPYDSIDAVKAFEAKTGDIARVVMFSHKDTSFSGFFGENSFICIGFLKANFLSSK